MSLATKAAALSKRGLKKPDTDYGSSACIMLLPRDQDVEGVKKFAAVDDLHCTVLYMGKIDKLKEKGVTPEQILSSLYWVIANQQPIKATLGGVTRFSGAPDDDGDPVVCTVNSNELHPLRQQVEKICTELGCGNASQFPYNPHMTLGYVDRGEKLSLPHWDETPVVFDRLWLDWGTEDHIVPLGTNEQKIIRMVRTRDGEGRYGHPIGALIVEHLEGSTGEGGSIEMMDNEPVSLQDWYTDGAIKSMQKPCIKCGEMLTHRDDEWQAKDGSIGCDEGGSHEVKDVFGGDTRGIGGAVQHDKPVTRKKRSKLKMRAAKLCRNKPLKMKADELALEFKVARDGDGDGFIYDGTPMMRPAPPGTPVVGWLKTGKESQYEEFPGPTVVDKYGNAYVVGKDPGGKGFVALGISGKKKSGWNDIAVDKAKTKKEALELLDAVTRRNRGAGGKPAYGSLDDNPSKMSMPKNTKPHPGKEPKATNKTPAKKTPAQRAKELANESHTPIVGKKAKATAKKTPVKKRATAAAKKTTKPKGDGYKKVGAEIDVVGQNNPVTIDPNDIDVLGVGGVSNPLTPTVKKRSWVQINKPSKTYDALRAKYGFPPAWEDVQINLSRDETKPDHLYDGLVVTGVAVNGKRQSIYTTRHRALKDGIKFGSGEDSGTVGVLRENWHKVMKQLLEDANGPESPKQQAASVVLLQSLTGLRIGGKKDIDKGVFGASTLQARHVTINQGSVKFDFMAKGNHKRLDANGEPIMEEKPNGKSGPIMDPGSPYQITIRNMELVKLMMKAKANKRGNHQLFDTDERKANAYIKEMRDKLGLKGADDLSTHNFRHAFASNLAAGLIESMKPPRNSTELETKQQEIAKKVGMAISDTPKVALASYIQHTLWDKWKKNIR